jgi:glycosyltransferase involved in cell wall biosynthesis
LQADRVAEEIAGARALLLLSTEEQFGLAVAESILLDTPVIVSDCVGARSSLVRQGVNGIVVETDNAQAVAGALRELAENEMQWTAMSESCSKYYNKADVSAFVTAINALDC